jgi:hypothetical protein
MSRQRNYRVTQLNVVISVQCPVVDISVLTVTEFFNVGLSFVNELPSLCIFYYYEVRTRGTLMRTSKLTTNSQIKLNSQLARAYAKNDVIHVVGKQHQTVRQIEKIATLITLSSRRKVAQPSISSLINLFTSELMICDTYRTLNHIINSTVLTRSTS